MDLQRADIETKQFADLGVLLTRIRYRVRNIQSLGVQKAHN